MYFSIRKRWFTLKVPSNMSARILSKSSDRASQGCFALRTYSSILPFFSEMPFTVLSKAISPMMSSFNIRIFHYVLLF